MKVAAPTVRTVFQTAGIHPAPERNSSTWADFLRSQECRTRRSRRRSPAANLDVVEKLADYLGAAVSAAVDSGDYPHQLSVRPVKTSHRSTTSPSVSPVQSNTGRACTPRIRSSSVTCFQVTLPPPPGSPALSGTDLRTGALVRADDHGIKPTIRSLRGGQHGRGAGALGPGPPARTAHVEALCHDRPVPGDGFLGNFPPASLATANHTSGQRSVPCCCSGHNRAPRIPDR